MSALPMRPARIVAAALVAALALVAGCASDKPKPPPLPALTGKVTSHVAWTGHVDGVRFPLEVAVSGSVFTVAGDDGTVLAVDADSGREVWRAAVGAKLSAGVGSDGRHAAVVTKDGELVVLDQGRVLWRKALGIRVTTAPLVAGERVFVLGIDRSVQGFDALDGRKLFALQRPGDPLTLAQSGVLTAFQDTLIVGQGASMAGIDPLHGEVRWEVTVGAPRGANEIERLADLVGPAARIGDRYCARSFQAAVGCVDVARGALAWTRNTGGTDAVAADAQSVYAADASDRVTAWKLASGEVEWSNGALLHRGLSAPVAIGGSVLFGDADGLVHWLARDTGEAQLRLPTDGSPVVAAPVAIGSTVLIVTRKGGLYAFRP